MTDEQDPIEAIIDYLTPTATDLLGRIDRGGEEDVEFTTGQFITLMEDDPDGDVAYHEALRRWGENERYAKMVVHGQVIPLILRRSNLVEWIGYAHGEADQYAVPAWWRLRR